MSNNDLIPRHLAPHGDAFERKKRGAVVFGLHRCRAPAAWEKPVESTRLSSVPKHLVWRSQTNHRSASERGQKRGPDHTSGPSIHDQAFWSAARPDATLRLRPAITGFPEPATLRVDPCSQ